MGKTYKELKKKIGQLRFENSFLTFKVEKVLLENGRVKRELQVSNARIVELAQEIELLKNGLPFADGVRETLSEWDSSTTYFGGEEVMFNGKKRAMGAGVGNTPKLGEEKAFSSRFMPNVKFKTFPSNADEHERKRIFNIIKDMPNFPVLYHGYITNNFGDIIYNGFESQEVMDNYNGNVIEEVSIYEAIPELVPNGMVYDKESDSLCYISKKYIRNAMVFEDEEFVNELYKEIHKQSEM